MKAITLRNIPPVVQKAIRAKARQKKISVNRAVIELLEEQVHHALLDALAGSWSSEEAKEFDEALRQIRRIDPELWT